MSSANSQSHGLVLDVQLHPDIWKGIRQVVSKIKQEPAPIADLCEQIEAVKPALVVEARTRVSSLETAALKLPSLSECIEAKADIPDAQANLRELRDAPVPSIDDLIEQLVEAGYLSVNGDGWVAAGQRELPKAVPIAA